MRTLHRRSVRGKIQDKIITLEHPKKKNGCLGLGEGKEGGKKLRRGIPFGAGRHVSFQRLHFLQKRRGRVEYGRGKGKKLTRRSIRN